ncbi:hypothetical protein C8R47DRAFT_1259480 [Mycena vitilis]|nr:hypothetical protein C8R47DRAFT_1259480 [Mycena vitilis]
MASICFLSLRWLVPAFWPCRTVLDKNPVAAVAGRFGYEDSETYVLRRPFVACTTQALSTEVLRWSDAEVYGHKPGTVMNYLSPEARFENRAGLEADVWALGCAIFEIRAGFPLFESFFGKNCFEEDGEPKSVEVPQERASTRLMSIRARLRLIGTEDSPAQDYEGPMMEMSGVRMPEAELELLADLLEKMLRYRPEERIGMDEVVGHPWFA